MSLAKYLRTIKNIDPGNIYVENVRSVYNVPRFVARVMCEMAVIDKVFVKKIGLICPAPTCHRRIIAEYNSYEEIPNQVECIICEAEGIEPFVYQTADLEKVEFYQLKKQNGEA